MSSFAWLDYSDEERRQMLDVIRLFKEKTTRDELGVGAIRDAFANMLFPGTSTIQTRARYFLFIPWIYLSLEKRRVPSRIYREKSRLKEFHLRDALMKSDDRDGLIGAISGRSLQRLPSAIYWSGLQRWGIRKFVGNQWQYFKSLDRYDIANRQIQNDNEDIESIEPRYHNWHAGLPKVPKGFPKGANFDIHPHEAQYLREQIQVHAPDTMLAFLLDRGNVVDDEVKYPWQHPQYAEFPNNVKRQSYHAQNFADVMHGAVLLYNLMLAEKGFNDLDKKWKKRIDDYNKDLIDWSNYLRMRTNDLERWGWRDEIRPGTSPFWQMVMSEGDKIHPQTIDFVNKWLSFVFAQNGAGTIQDNQDARKLVRGREWVMKGNLARLHSDRALELWGGASGTAKLNYRWSNARIIINDILGGTAKNSGGNNHA